MPSSVHIVTPMYGGLCYGGYTIGLLDTLDKLKDLEITMHYSELGNESLITRGRNRLVNQFLRTDSEYLIFIDADIIFKAEDVLKLIFAEKEIICGLYPRKNIDWESVRKAANNGEKNLEDYSCSFVANPKNLDWSTPFEGIVPIEEGGTGFMCIHRSVFEKLSPLVSEYRECTVTRNEEHSKRPDGSDVWPLTKNFFDVSIAEDGLYLSEDYHFCRLWNSIGGTVYADTSINLKHVGTHVFSGSLSYGLNPPSNYHER